MKQPIKKFLKNIFAKKKRWRKNYYDNEQLTGVEYFLYFLIAGVVTVIIGTLIQIYEKYYL